MANLAGHLAHVGLVELFHRFRFRFVMTTHECADHTFETGGVLA